MTFMRSSTEEALGSFDSMRGGTGNRISQWPALIAAEWYTSSKSLPRGRHLPRDLVSLNISRSLHSILLSVIPLRKAAWIKFLAAALIMYGMLYMCWTQANMATHTTLPRPNLSMPNGSRPSATSARRFVSPNLIPRIIHQTYKSSTLLPQPLQKLHDTWRRVNPGWETRIWDDYECRDFVRRQFPEYFAAYMGLPKDVERADFFRYLVVLRLGGVYADIDTACLVPLDDVIRPTDTLVVGWEAEEADDRAAAHRHLSRKRQIQQWAFAGAAEHPALRDICDHIHENYLTSFSNYTNMDTLERTGPGAWTDAVLKNAMAHPLSEAEDPWHVRILPLIATAVHPKAKSPSELKPDSKGIVIQHMFLGSWKHKGGWQHSNILTKLKSALRSRNPPPLSHPTDLAHLLPSSVPKHYPVAINHDPVFSILVDLVGSGDKQSREDVSSVLTKYGNWQAGVEPTSGPSAVSALIGSMGKGKDSPNGVFLDIGAGLGFYSLSAAARGHQVIATELSRASVDAMTASIAYNGLQHSISVRSVTVGNTRELACTNPGNKEALVRAWLPEDVARGYAHPDVHADPLSPACASSVPRVLMEDLVHNDTNVQAVRLSAGGWTGRVLEGGLPWLAANLPAVMLIEMDAAEMERIGYTRMSQLLYKLYEMGYTDMSHAGRVCEERYESLTQEIRGKGHWSRGAQVEQPTWCRLEPTDFIVVPETNRQHGVMGSGGVELLLLVREQVKVATGTGDVQ